jgi:hypothetical protein
MRCFRRRSGGGSGVNGGLTSGGWGVAWAAADAARGAGGVDADRLADMAAAEAVASLGADFGADKMPSGDPDYFPGPIAEALYWADDDVLGIQGPVGSGKTTTVLKSRLRRALAMPRSTIDGWRRYKLLVVRETYRQLWSTTIPSYLEAYPKAMGTWSGGRGDPVTHVIQFEDAHGPVEFRVEFMAFGDDVIASMRGVQTTDIWLNETDTVPVEVLMVGIGRIDRWPGAQHFEGYPPELRGYGQIVCDFNAPDEDNWTFRVFHDPEERERIAQLMTQGLPEGARAISIQFFNQPGYGQPGCENLTKLSASYYPRQIAAMRLAGRGDMIDRLVNNKITYLRAGQPVFQREFNRRIHVSDGPLELVPGAALRIGLDQGFKGAAVVAQFVPPYHWRIYAELHFPNERLMAAEFGRRLADLLESPRFRGVRIEAAWGDLAGEAGASAAEDENRTWNLMVGRKCGFTVRPQKLGNNRLQPRLEGVRAALEFVHGGQPGLLIDPACRFMIRGFEARYVWTDEVTSTGDKRKVPDKSLTEANVMDAGQYVILSEVLADGTSPISSGKSRATLMRRHNGGPALTDAPPGVRIGWDVLNPYGA